MPSLEYEVRQTRRFQNWLEDLRDQRAKARISRRLTRLQSGLFGDAKTVDGSVRELRVDYGPGYRVYFIIRGRQIILLLCGGDKSTQGQDIKTAIGMAKGYPG